MGGLGGSEIIVIAVLFLLIFGPSKLPQMAKDIGKFIGSARSSIDEFKDELTAETGLDDEKKPRRNSSRPSKNGTSSEKSGVSAKSSAEDPAEDDVEGGLRDL